MCLLDRAGMCSDIGIKCENRERRGEKSPSTSSGGRAWKWLRKYRLPTPCLPLEVPEAVVRWSKGQDFAVENVLIEQHNHVRLQHDVNRLVREPERMSQ